MAHLSLGLLGPLHITLDGQPVSFAYNKARALLTYLAVEADHAHHRDTLVGLLWPDLPDRAARTNLRQVLANLREAIEDASAIPPFLRITPDTVQFNPESEYDLDVMLLRTLLNTCEKHLHRGINRCRACAERLEQANALYRGDFMAQFSLPDSAAFEEWAQHKREALHAQAVNMLSHLAAYHERRGAFEQARQALTRQLELDPWREEAHRHLMSLLAGSGQRSAALTQYETCRRILATELTVEPAAETTALYERIRDGLEVKESGSAPTRLPQPPTPLVGRQLELAELGDLLANPANRLITIVGLGGIGKTRLALAAAAEQAETFNHGAVFIPLASLSSTTFLESAMIAALNLPRQQGQQNPKDQLTDYLRDKEMLLVLDNFEHLLEGAALLADILQQAPQITFLVTSHERLNLQGEWVFDLYGLPFPESDETWRAESYSAVVLFAQQARRLKASFAFDEERPFIVRICQLVEGMPLAIELAAAWVRTRSCQAIAQEIEQNLNFLKTSGRDRPERHRSLQAVFNQAWTRLSENEQQVYSKLSVFRGGFYQEAAKRVAGASPAILASLIDKSLVRQNADGREGRYDLQELLRQFAYETLQNSGQRQEVHKHHLEFFLQLAEEAEPKLRGAEQPIWLERLEVEHDNLRAALGWSLQPENEMAEARLKLTGHLWWFWFLRGYWSEGRKWLTAYRNTSTGSLQADVLSGVGWLALFQGDYESLAQFSEASLALSKELGDHKSTATFLDNLGMVSEMQGEYEQAKTLFTESLALRREAEDKIRVAASLLNLGRAVMVLGDYEGATVLLQECLALNQELGDDWNTTWARMHLGLVALFMGEGERAISLLGDCLTQFQQLGDPLGTNFSLLGLGAGAVLQGDPSCAARLFGAVESIGEATGFQLSPGHRQMCEPFVAAAREQLGEAAFAAAWAEGKGMSLEQAIEIAIKR